MSDDHDALLQIKTQELKVTTLYELVGTMSSEMTACTHAMRDLTTQFAVYTEKHDHTERSLKSLVDSQTRIHESITAHSIEIAQMKPTVESVRGLVWKVITSILLGMGGLGVVVAALPK